MGEVLMWMWVGVCIVLLAAAIGTVVVQEVKSYRFFARLRAGLKAEIEKQMSSIQAMGREHSMSGKYLLDSVNVESVKAQLDHLDEALEEHDMEQAQKVLTEVRREIYDWMPFYPEHRRPRRDKKK
jgi:hypothetical protein